SVTNTGIRRIRSRVSQLASPMGRSVYHTGAGPRLGDAVARQRTEKADRQIDVQLDMARSIAPRQHPAALVAERQRGALAVGDPQGQVADGRQRALDGRQERLEA